MMPTYQLGPRLSLYYLDLNLKSEQTVLLLHGLGANADSWQLQTPPLVEGGYRVIAPDLRGFGRSTYPGKISVPAMAADCQALLEYLNIPNAHVVGISMGGTVALQLGLDAHPRVSSLVLINTFARLERTSPGHFLTLLRRMCLVIFGGFARQAEMVSRDLFPHPNQDLHRHELYQQIMMSDPRAYRAAMFDLWRFNVLSRLANIQAPCLVITAENDRTVAPHNQAQLTQKIPGARQVLIPGAGHAVTAERSDLVNQALLTFLGQSA